MLTHLTGVDVRPENGPVFAKLFGVRAVAELGDKAGFTALVLVLAAGTNSATMLSTLLAALVVVDAVVTPACGWVADRFNRRSVMILADVGAAAA